MDKGSELETGGPSFNSSRIRYIHLGASAFGKGMSSPLLSPVLGHLLERVSV